MEPVGWRGLRKTLAYIFLLKNHLYFAIIIYKNMFSLYFMIFVDFVKQSIADWARESRRVACDKIYSTLQQTSENKQIRRDVTLTQEQLDE